MPQIDPRIDAYIAKAAPFAQPILTHFRALVHRALPEVEEGIKWSMPAFMIGGKNVAGMAAFKAHCAIMIQYDGRQGESEGMGGYGKVTTLADLPEDAALEAKIAESGRRVAQGRREMGPKAKKSPKPEIPMPDDFAAALAASPDAQRHFDGFAPSYRRDYLEWITTAKAPATRIKRIGEAVAWLAEGKKRHWKYESC